MRPSRTFITGPARLPGRTPAQAEDAGMPTATIATDPDRHALITPDCDCGLCAPTWARRRGKSRRFSDPVTLAAALEREHPAARAGMVDQHHTCLAAMVSAADELITATPSADPDRAGAGLSLVLFAGELASAIQPDSYRDDLPADLTTACEQTITAAMLAAAATLTGVAEILQILATLPALAQ
jgi:hypothetical protein